MKSSDLLKEIPRGYFLEAGAHDGIGDSTTYVLEQAGWAGLCVEPSAAFHGLELSRKCHIDNRALWNEDDAEIDFREIEGNQIELSGIEGQFRDNWDRSQYKFRIVRKKTVTLPTLLKKYWAPELIDFFSLDTEGSEFEILVVHDFDKYNFRYLCVENNGNLKKRDNTHDLLFMYNYKLIDRNEAEDWFKYKG